jgi:hypothetical protein
VIILFPAGLYHNVAASSNPSFSISLGADLFLLLRESLLEKILAMSNPTRSPMNAARNRNREVGSVSI